MEGKVRIAAVGDIHVSEHDQGKWSHYFREASKDADVLLLCGDLTDTGHLTEAEILAEELRACTIPVIGVLGNHDYERGQQKTIKKILEKEDVHILDGEAIVVRGVGFAGVKGFGGGFDRYTLSMFGEDMIKKFVEETVNDSLRLDRALVRLESQHDGHLKKVVIMHYSPIKATVVGEPEEIFPFLGSSRLAEPLETREVIAAFHGHAHHGTLAGTTPKGVKVFNVSKVLLHKEGFDKGYYILEV
jgi:Icc-related predicted phosphoesterase